MIILEASSDSKSDSSTTLERLANLKIQRNMLEQRRIAKIKLEYENKIQKEEEIFAEFRKKFVSFTKNLKQAKGSEEQEAEVALLLHGLLDKWALWLDSVEGNIKNGDYMTKLTDFLKIFEQDSIKTLKPSEEYVDGYANMAKLGKAFLKQDKYEEAQKVFSEVIENEPDFSEVAHYYMAHCIVKLENMEDNVTMETFLDNLHHAKILMEKRIDELQTTVALINSLRDLYKESQNSFLINDDYEKQIEGIIDLYSPFLRSIDDICGHEVTSAMITNIVTDPLQTRMIFNDLQKEDILEGHKISPNYQKGLAKIREVYAMYFNGIQETVQKVLKEKEKTSSEDFQHVLPSREEFWECLQKSGIVLQEEQYVLVDMNKIAEVDFSLQKEFHKSLEEKFQSKCQYESEEESKGFVWLYPEQVQHMEKKLLIQQKPFEAHFGKIELWKVLEEQNVLLCNKKARINSDVDLESIQLGKYDAIYDDAFTIVEGIDDTASKEIFCQLINQEILSEDNPARLLTSDVNELFLQKYQQYRTEVVNVLEMSFKYRLELSRFVEGATPTLLPKPHVSLFSDLINYKIVTPVRVNCNDDEDEVKEKLNELYCVDSCEQEKQARITKEEIIFICCLHELNDTETKEVINTMKKNKWIEDHEENYKITCTEDLLRKPRQYSIPYQRVEFPLKNLLLGKIKTEQFCSKLNDELVSWRSGLSKYDSIGSDLKDLKDYLDSETKQSMFAEFNIFSQNGLDHVIILCEEEWSWTCIFKIFAIAVIGALQVVAGAVLEVVSLGVATNIASALIGEGVGDLMFALECSISGTCSFKEYWKQKKISLIMTVISGGVGAFFSRGAQFSKYGYKIGGKALAKTAGKELVEESSKRAIFKQVGKDVGKRMLKATASTLANAGIDYVIQNLIQEQLKKVYDEIIEKVLADADKKIDEYQLQQRLHKLQGQVGVEKANQTIETIHTKIQSQLSNNDKIRGYLSQVAGSLCSGFGEAAEKLEACGDNRAEMMSKITKILSNVIKAFNVLQSVHAFATLSDTIYTKIKTEIDTAINKNKMGESEHEVDLESQRNIREEWKQIVNYMAREKLEGDFLKPAIQSCSNKAIHYAGKGMKKTYRKMESSVQKRKFQTLQASHKKEIEQHEQNKSDTKTIKSIKEEYAKGIIELQKKVKDPMLFAQMIREDIPLDITSVNALEQIIGMPIKINIHGGHETKQLGNAIHKGANHDNAIEIDFHVGPDGVGHFSSNATAQQESKLGTAGGGESNHGHHDCLLKALEEHGVSIDREAIAKKIETDRGLRNDIKQGWHGHYMAKGGVGGLPSAEERRSTYREEFNFKPKGGWEEKLEVLKKQNNLTDIRKEIETIKKQVEKETKYVQENLKRINDKIQKLTSVNATQSKKQLNKNKKKLQKLEETDQNAKRKQQNLSDMQEKLQHLATVDNIEHVKNKLAEKETIQLFKRGDHDKVVKHLEKKRRKGHKFMDHTNNHELLPRAHVGKWYEYAQAMGKSTLCITDKTGKVREIEYDHVELFIQPRRDTGTVMFVHEGEIKGHPGAFEGNKETQGSHGHHKELNKQFSHPNGDPRSAREGMIRALVYEADKALKVAEKLDLEGEQIFNKDKPKARLHNDNENIVSKPNELANLQRREAYKLVKLANTLKGSEKGKTSGTNKTVSNDIENENTSMTKDEIFDKLSDMTNKLQGHESIKGTFSDTINGEINNIRSMDDFGDIMQAYPHWTKCELVTGKKNDRGESEPNLNHKTESEHDSEGVAERPGKRPREK